VVGISELLRTVPTFVSEHTFCASRKTWSNHHARARVFIDIINDSTKYAEKMIAIFSTVTKLNEPELRPGTPELQHIANHLLLTASS